MRILFQLGHPAHFHLFKNIVINLQKRGHDIHVLIKTKDILEDLVSKSGIPYTNILPEGRTDGKLGVLVGVFKRDVRIFKYARKHRIDLLIGSTAEIAHVGRLLHIPSIYLGEDDTAVARQFCQLTYPFVDEIIQPVSCNAGRWEKKSLKYAGYQKLAYLHPAYFTPDKARIPEINVDDRYFIIRLVSLAAHHDGKMSGLSNEILDHIINKLENHGTVYLSSEIALPGHYQKYTLPIDIQQIHHALYFADLYIGDSQSMAVESALLGVPNIRFNDFAGRIGVLEELEHVYGLTTGIRTDAVEQLYAAIDSMLATPNLKQVYQDRRSKLLSEKINVTEFFTWFFENYPESARIIKSDPDYQYRFR
jgi:hypothetical protein